MYLNYPNNPTGAVVPDGLFERAVGFAREHDVLVVHDASYTETTFDGYVAPSFLETPGAREVGVEIFSLSKGWNMTGWRTAALVGNPEAVEAYWRLKTNIDSGMFEALQLAAAAALDAGPPEEMRALYQRRRDLVCDTLREIGVEVADAEGHHLRLGAGAGGAHLGVVLRARARGVRGGGVARRGVRAERRGLLPHLADRGRRAAQPRPSSGCGGASAADALLRRGARAGRASAGDAGGGAHSRAADPAQRHVLRARPGRAGGRRGGRPARGGGGGRGAAQRDLRAPGRRRAPATRRARAPAGRGHRAARRAAGPGAVPPEGSEGEGPIREGDYREFPLFETNADGVFCALQGRLLPAKRHPLGMQLRIEELERRPRVRRGRRSLAPPDRGDRRGGLRPVCPPLRGRPRLLARRPRPGGVVLPGSALPEQFPRQGVLPPVERLQLRPVSG